MRRIVLALLLSGTLAAPPARAGLFDDLGAKPGLTRITEGLMRRALADPRISATFADADLPRLHLLLAAHLCQVAGGPCKYPGRRMTEAHAGLHLRPRHMNALVEDLQDAMSDEGVPFATQNRLLARLVPFQQEVVQP